MSLEEELETQISKNLKELIKQFEKYKEGLGYRKVITCDKCINWENLNGVQGQCKKFYGLGSYYNGYCSEGEEK